jgi:hypothetical protein
MAGLLFKIAMAGQAPGCHSAIHAPSAVFVQGIIRSRLLIMPSSIS